jgi:pyrroline-5-carboxylate reductase
MPNTPALVLSGAAGISPGRAATPQDVALVERIFGAVGRAVVVSDDMMDAVTGLSGSGPAFIFALIEGLADGGVLVGLTRQIATVLAAQTVLGAAKMVLETGKHPGELKDMVTSPAGTTHAGPGKWRSARFDDGSGALCHRALAGSGADARPLSAVAGRA